MSSTTPNNAPVVVAGGSKATLFRDAGHGTEVCLHKERRLATKNLTNDGPFGSCLEERSPRRSDGSAFAKRLARRLDAMRNQGAHAALVLAAAAQTLGQLRDAMSKTVKGGVVVSVAKDLTNHAAQETDRSTG